MKRPNDQDNHDPKRPKLSTEEIQRKIQLAKQKLAENTAKAQIAVEKQNTATAGKGGLNVAFHPALLKTDQRYTNPYKAAKSSNSMSLKEKEPAVMKKPELKLLDKFDDPTKHEFYDKNLHSLSSFAPKPKTRKTITFIEPGKYVKEANQLRQQQKLEKLKNEIAEAARKSGIERELELVSNSSLRQQEPPVVEWWDQKLVDRNYDAFDMNYPPVKELVTNLVQHPIPIEPPGLENAPPPRPLLLTKKERKKLRRQARIKLQQEKQDKQRAGLIPPDAPRVTKQNFMRVLGQDAILTPSVIEAEMAKQVAERQAIHKQHNEKNKLTEEERKAKKDRKLRENTDGEVHVAVFKIKKLVHKPHMFKINANARQHKLTGICVMNEALNLVIVEGGPKGTKAYKRLMLERINWNETPVTEMNTNLNEDNECLLVWDGLVSSKSFNTFRMQNFDSILDIKKHLEDNNAVNYWNAARTYVNQGKIPKQEDHDLTPATRLLERKREMLEVESSLIKQKEEFSMKMESLSQRRDELARKETQLKESLMKFDRFLQENDAKRLRASKKAIDERKIKDQKELEINDLKQTQKKYVARKDLQLQCVETSLSYQRYLESLLENGSEYTEIRDILGRYDTLAATNAELLARAAQAQARTESDRAIFNNQVEEKNNMILNYNNRIGKLKTQLEEKQATTARWQSELDQVVKNASQKSLLLGQVKM